MANLERPEELMFDLPREQVERFSPKSLAIIESQTLRDLHILEKLYGNGNVLVNDQSKQSWRIHQYTKEFDMTESSVLFPPLPQWETRGYLPDSCYGRWINPNGDVALPDVW